MTSATLVTEDDLVAWLRRSGAGAGDVLLVHCSLSAFGRVVGGEQAVISALRRVVGSGGTIVMPAQSWQLCDPDYLADPALDAAQRDLVRRNLPPFDARLTPTRTMGAVAELFRTLPGVRRSPHPHRSFSAWGAAADAITATQPFDAPFGEGSPLAALYARRAKVVLLGVGYESCTALHLAEMRSGRATRRTVPNGAPVRVDGERVWVTWDEPMVEDADFPAMGAEFESAAGILPGRIADATCRLVPLVALVDFAVDAMHEDSPV